MNDIDILFFQYGDFPEAYERFKLNGNEAYRDQRESVSTLLEVSDNFNIHVVCIAKRQASVVIKSGFSCEVISEKDAWDKSYLQCLLTQWNPSALVCRTPNPYVLGWAAKKGVPTLPVFADSFSDQTWRDRWRNLRMKMIFKKLSVPVAANHGRWAAHTLGFVGVPENKRLAWDLNPVKKQEPRFREIQKEDKLKIVYVGAMERSKGIGTLIEACAGLKQKSVPFELKIVGHDSGGQYSDRSNELGIQDDLIFEGRVALENIIPLMADSDVVVVPTHKDYQEGLPNTIFEAMAAGTALAVSDHPAFVNSLRGGRDVLVHRAGDAVSLADSLIALKEDSRLRKDLAVRAQERLSKLYTGVSRRNLFDAFIGDPTGCSGWPEKLVNNQRYNNYEN